MNDLEFRSFILERLAGIVGYLDGFFRACYDDGEDESGSPSLKDLEEILSRLKEFQGEARSHANGKEETRSLQDRAMMKTMDLSPKEDDCFPIIVRIHETGEERVIEKWRDVPIGIVLQITQNSSGKSES